MSKPSVYFEEDVQQHNAMLEAIIRAKDTRTVPDYQLTKSLDAVDAIAALISAKATKQANLILNKEDTNE